MTKRMVVEVILAVCLAMVAMPVVGAEKVPLDRVALQGVKVGNGINQSDS